MCKYSKEIVLQSVPDNAYRTTRFSVQDMDSKEECDKELFLWINMYPELLKIDNNKHIIKNTLGINV